ncbi:MAG: hypothetical protein RDU24_11935 [Humidesulfovibrio sp.]|uniref:hypothetical protein n=1 Tax=Humidesulfovibrio sp. TaxID=2910988 RepID=UPI0027FD0514|nr:hypothetical protein [Humidesulfovibrio sp.]MDQ7836084.1 hypothetical protein [Humidesulfovibrio sp.]
MKRLLAFALFVLLFCFATSAFAADAPKLVGTWEGIPSVHGAKVGYRTGKLVVTIVEQQGNAFHGTKTYQTPRRSKTESFSGTIRSDGQIFIADHDEGYMLGDLTKDGDLELQYGHRGKNAIAVYVLLKKK